MRGVLRVKLGYHDVVNRVGREMVVHDVPRNDRIDGLAIEHRCQIGGFLAGLGRDEHDGVLRHRKVVLFARAHDGRGFDGRGDVHPHNFEGCECLFADRIHRIERIARVRMLAEGLALSKELFKTL